LSRAGVKINENKSFESACIDAKNRLPNFLTTARIKPPKKEDINISELSCSLFCSLFLFFFFFFFYRPEQDPIKKNITTYATSRLFNVLVFIWRRTLTHPKAANPANHPLNAPASPSASCKYARSQTFPHESMGHAREYGCECGGRLREGLLGSRSSSLL
jgi:hypothetical protein